MERAEEHVAVYGRSRGPTWSNFVHGQGAAPVVTATFDNSMCGVFGIVAVVVTSNQYKFLRPPSSRANSKLKSPPVCADMIRAQVAIDVGICTCAGTSEEIEGRMSLNEGDDRFDFRFGVINDNKANEGGPSSHPSSSLRALAATATSWTLNLKDAPKPNTAASVAVCAGAAGIETEVDRTGVEIEPSAWMRVERMEHADAAESWHWLSALGFRVGLCEGTEHVVSAGAAAVQDPSFIVMCIRQQLFFNRRIWKKTGWLGIEKIGEAG
ncbi:hypothetical protein GALMADRAFT_217083 [Galerina marginata CBS 339.88]|uniref:Uncharacterized protein n=1 Tax=Galerina marginata (strain CBS 339.88) TaxID=685588 RepID=A0A067SHW0_GALM3|nr:hypothetical protein GALMADRAFT_217083 [Galerina marginata CBS 339.88]